MKIIVEKKIFQGWPEWKFGGDFKNYGREITGHTHETGNPTLALDGGEICYGCHKKTFYQATCQDWPVLYLKDTTQERADKIRDRLVLIRDWVESCKEKDFLESGHGEADVPPTIASLMAKISEIEQGLNQKPSRLPNGRFCKKEV